MMLPHAKDMLKKVPLFENVGEASIDWLAQKLVEKKVAKDAHIVSRDEPGDAMFIITKGRVKVVIQGDAGREVILNILKVGDFFGEMSLLDDMPRSAHVVAVEDSKVLILRRDDFRTLIQQSPTSALHILAELSRRLRRADELISNLSLLDVYSRVAHILIDMAKRDGQPTDEGTVIRDRPTQQDMAAMIGTSRETVSRVLSEFQRRGFIEMKGREIVLSHKFSGEMIHARSPSA